MKNKLNALLTVVWASMIPAIHAENLKKEFLTPPDSARPGVYWYFMDGNQDRGEMVADLHAMKSAGIGSVLFLEVDLGMPRGPVSFMSEPWLHNVAHAFVEAGKLGMEVVLGTGPGWSGSGGTWVEAADSMQHLVGVGLDVSGPGVLNAVLPLPPPHKANRFAGMSPAHAAKRDAWFQDAAVLAFPKPAGGMATIDNVDIKTLKDVKPFSIKMTKEAFVMPMASYPEPDASKIIDYTRAVDLTSKLKPDGSITWDIPDGEWTVMRFVARSTGQTTRPAPQAGHGFECNKFDAASYQRHWVNYQKVILDKVVAKAGPLQKGKGLTTIHLDSWEMSSQNWTETFRKEFQQRRGYDPQPFYPAYMGMVVGSAEKTERFLWDMRKTSQELVLEQHAEAIKKLAHKEGLLYSNQPYDMNPAGDIDLGSIADIPACEFWYAPHDTQYSCIEAVSISHTMGQQIVKAEGFTSELDAFANHPANMKNQTDWAFAIGINGINFHTYQHQALGKEEKPGMTMGPYGIQWHRNQTLWDYLSPYHEYITRCSHLLRQGEAVADILYLTAEGAPSIFEAPVDAVEGPAKMRDKKGYSFDAVSPRILDMRAVVENGRIAFPGGSKYRVLVLPNVPTMTPETLACIERLVKAGATVIGNPPIKSPSLVNYPACDVAVSTQAAKLWGGDKPPAAVTRVPTGSGAIYWGGELSLPSPVSQQNEALSTSEWIWYPEGNPAASAVPGTRYFQRTIEVDGSKKLASATAAVNADNEFTLWINGQKVSDGTDFRFTSKSSIASFLRPGPNVLTVAVTNAGPGATPAGWIGAFELSYNDGTRIVVNTDYHWAAGVDAPEGWEKLTTTPDGWNPALELGDYAMSPWSLGGSETQALPLYSTYEQTAAILKSIGVVEDFTATGPVRYAHRRTDDRDIYFVSNKTGDPIKADCRFRMAAGNPELWDPVTGERRALPQFERKDGTTTIPMEFDAFQSFFVVFGGKDDVPALAHEKNFPGLKAVQELSGAWQVAFDPKWGGPEEVTFDALQDWTKHSDSGIKYYSGTATYRTTFDVPGFNPANKTKTFLDLGTVHEICRVRLNGKELGILWTSPWRVDITSALKATGNQLEIEVANGWVNRLIGDQQSADQGVRKVQWPSGLLAGKELPAGRFTFVTHSHYKASSPLRPAGLIGPVSILVNTP